MVEHLTLEGHELIEEFTKDCNCVFHSKALTSILEPFLKLRECIEIETMGALNILEDAIKNYNCKLIFTSSAANDYNNRILY